jgi:hypothetical protein
MHAPSGLPVYEIEDHDALVQLAVQELDEFLMGLVLFDEIGSIVVRVELNVRHEIVSLQKT